MKTRKPTDRLRPLIVVWTALTFSIIWTPGTGLARPRPPLPPLPEFAPLLSRAGFDEPFGARAEKPEAFHPAYVDLVDGWSGYSLRRAGMSVTPFVVPGSDETGHVSPNGANGAVRFWFRPYWSSGAGPGVVARLVELSAVGNSDAVSAWSLLVSPDGSVLSLAGPDGALLRTEINWQVGQWHLVALNYGPKYSALFIDGALMTEGGGTLAVPPQVTAFSVGSTLTGGDPAGGEFDEFCIFAGSLSEPAVAFCHQLYAPTAARGPISPEEEAAQRAAAAKRRAERETAGEGGGTQMLRLLGGTSQCITSPVVFITNVVATFDTNANTTTVTFDVQGGTNGFFYDIFTTANLAGDSITNSQWTWLERGPTCSTYQYTNLPGTFTFYVLGTPQDSDNDGLTDAYENLVSHTSPTNANSPRPIYEGVISNQNPSAWFKLNDESGNGLADAQGGQSLTNGGGVWDPDAFAIGNGAFSFTADGNRLTAGDVISGGSGTNQGTISLLFRSLTGLATTRRFVFWQEDGNNTNRFGVFFEDDNAGPFPGNLCVQIGGRTNSILASNAIVFGAWYHLAMTWDENGHAGKWYLGQVGGTLTSGTITNLIGNVGNSSTVYLGNRHSLDRSFRFPGSGALDEIAFWNRELTSAEVNAQFDTLKALFQGPARVFDLTRWNLLLPVDKLNQLNSNNVPLKITWLNSGFKYVDPTNWTQQYFYLSSDNKLVFDAPWNGADTDTTGNSARSELRETLPNGSDRNWLPLGTNILEATCAVDSAGTNNDQKVIIGQIHSDTASDPPVVVSYNFPNPNRVGKVTVTVKDNPDGSDNTLDGSSADRNFTLATNVSPGVLINYRLELVGTTNSVILSATINGEARDVTMYQNGDSTWTNANWKATPFYFKAGAYYPKATNSGTAKVTFSSLVITPQP